MALIGRILMYFTLSRLRNGIAQGLCTELVQAVLRELQISAPIEFLPWARAYDVAQHSGNVLIYSIARTPL
jgi:polar amino acid transport system substrate-binding protein